MQASLSPVCCAPFAASSMTMPRQAYCPALLTWLSLPLSVTPAGPFAVGVRELLGHYMVLEEQFMEDTSDMAIRIDEVVSLPGCLSAHKVHVCVCVLGLCRPCLWLEPPVAAACRAVTWPHAAVVTHAPGGCVVGKGSKQTPTQLMKSDTERR